MTEPTFFAPRIADTTRRARALTDHAQGRSEAERRYVSAAIEELNATLEELRVADEEIRQQNAQLELSIERAEREHRRYYTLFEFAPIGLLVTDASGVIREANRAASLLFTCERHHLIGKPLLALLDDVSRRELRDHLGRVFSAPGPVSAWGTTAPSRGQPRRIILTLEADTFPRESETPEKRIRWAIQPRGNGGEAAPD